MRTKLLALSIVLGSSLLISMPVMALERSSTNTGAVRENVKERLEKVKEKVVEKRETQKEQAVTKVRKSVDVRETALSRAIDLASRILDKLQVRIDKAKETGKDVTGMITLMTDARGKLSDAKTILTKVEAQKETAVDKAGFVAIHGELKTVRKDIQDARHDAAKIISQLKGFNSATTSAEKE